MKKVTFFVHIILVAVIVMSVPLSKTNQSNNLLGIKSSTQKFETGSRVNNKDLVAKLLFNGESLPYDDGSSTFYLPLSMKTKEWEVGELSPENSNVTIQFMDNMDNVNKLDAIADNKTFSFVAFTDHEYGYYHLAFTGLPIMKIDLSGEKLGDKALIEMSLFDSESKSKWVQQSKGALTVHGGTSRRFPKLSYKLELYKYDRKGDAVNNNINLLNMRKDNDWILNAMYGEETKIRDKLSIDIWNAFGANDNAFNCDFGTKMEYIEMFINNEYYGIYGLMEPVDAKKLNIDHSGNEEKEEYIYKRKQNQGLSVDEISKNENMQARNGFELKNVDKYGDTSNNPWDPLMNFAKVQTNEDDENYKSEISNVVDINSALDTWLFLQIVSGVDNLHKNMYYVAKQVDSEKKLFFVPWDLDLTWGKVYKNTESLLSIYAPSRVTEEIKWEPGERLIKTNTGNSVTLVKKKWKSLRENILSDETLLNKIDELKDEVNNSGAMARETKRWSEGGHTTDYSTIKQYAVKRMDYLDSYFENLENK